MKRLQHRLNVLIFMICLFLGMATWKEYNPAAQNSSGWLGFWHFDVLGRHGTAFLGKEGVLFVCFLKRTRATAS